MLDSSALECYYPCMTNFCCSCDNPTETAFFCAHCDEPVCPDCADDAVDYEDEDTYSLEGRDIIFTVCRRCRE
jgi:hypothetical protein